MQSKQDRRTRSLAFGIGAACVALELLMLVVFSHANAPDGRLFAGDSRCYRAVATEVSPVIFLRRLELSL